MRTLIASLLLLGSLSAIAQSGLPPCPEGGTYRNNCFGAFTFSSGSIYTGEWQGGKPNGRGTHTWPDGANYVGEFRDGVRAGQGTFTFKDGATYVGEYLDGKHHGQGTFTSSSGNRYVGGWQDNKFHGQGTFISKSGNRHVGEWRDGKRNGQGIEYAANGSILQSGRWDDNKLVQSYPLETADFPFEASTNPLGQIFRGVEGLIRGVLTGNSTPEKSREPDPQAAPSVRRDEQGARSVVPPPAPISTPSKDQRNTPANNHTASGTNAIEQFRLPPCPRDKPEWNDCFATLSFPDGRLYVGEFKNTVFHGKGSFSTPDGHHYIGEFSNGKYNGHGSMTFPNGARYTGDWKEQKFYGEGTFTTPNGTQHVGEFRDNEIVGQGIQYSASGVVMNSGRWENGNLVQTYALSTSRFPFTRNTQQIRLDQESAEKTRLESEAKKPTGATEAERRRLDAIAKEASESKAADALRAEASESERRRTGGAIGQSRLPPCPAAGERHNCFGTLSNSNGWRYIGEFQNGRQHGEGIYYTATGNVVDMGRWESGRVAHYYPLDTSLFPFNFDIAEMRRMETDRLAREAGERKAAEARAETERRRLESERIANEARERQLAEAREAERRKQEAAKPADRRVAMVIGNSNYKVNRLDNPVNDATDMATALRGLGFEVTLLRDATLSQMRAATRKFEESVLGADVALIFYAGHGIEAKGRNYMIPVSADIQREYELDDQAYNAGQWLDMLEGAKGKNAQRVNIVILDACRDNTLSRSWRSSARGLGRMDAPSGTVLVYSTAPGKVAADGAAGQRNSPFTKHLLQSLQTPNVPIELVLRETRRKVVAETKGEQVPWEHSSLIGEFVFRVQR